MSIHQIAHQQAGKYGLSEEGYNYYLETRNTPPSRVTARHARWNVKVHFPSEKMGFTLICESRNESYAAMELERDPDVREFYDQPPAVFLKRKDRQERTRHDQYTPDFLYVSNLGIVALEVKTRKALERLTTERPWEWVYEGAEAVCLPAREHFAAMGITHKVVAPDARGSVRYANLQLLLSAQQLPRQLDEDQAGRILKTLSGQAWMSVWEAAQLVSSKDCTGVLQLIAAGVVACDLDKRPLAQPETALITLRSEVLEAAYELTGSLPSAETPLSGPLYRLSEDQLSRARDRLERLNTLPRREFTRQDYRNLRKLERGRREGVPDLVALAPMHKMRGNRKAKQPDNVVSFAREYCERYLTGRRVPKRALYSEYRNKAREVLPGSEPVTKPTFYGYLKELDPEKVARARLGRRAANQVAPASPVESRSLRPNLPFMEARIDHCTVDSLAEILRVGDHVLTSRPHLSALVDRSNNLVLAYYLSLHAPNKVSTAMLLRQCARQYGRLPAMIGVDRGADFMGTAVDSLLAHYGIGKIVSPAGNPRFGAEVERFFKEFKDNWLASRPGFTADIGSRRGIDRNLAPEKQACITPIKLLAEIERFVSERNNRLHGARSETPQTITKKGMTRFSCVGIPVNVDQDFRFISAVDSRRLRFDPGKGLKVGDMRYWDPSLYEIRDQKTVDVRLEPENPYLVYAYIKGEWKVLKAAGYQNFESLPPYTRQAEAMWLYGGSGERQKARQEAHDRLMAAQSELDLHLEDGVVESIDEEHSALPFDWPADLPDAETLPAETWQQTGSWSEIIGQGDHS